MKIRYLVALLFVAVLTGCVSSLGSFSTVVRQVGYVEQEKPGALVIVTITEKSNAAAVISIMDVRTGMRDNHTEIGSTVFQEIWLLMNSEELAEYKFTPTQSDSMSDPEFYTITLKSNGKDLYFRLPVGSLSGKSKNVVEIIKSYIKAKKLTSR